MKKTSLKEKSWYPLTVAICIGVLFYFLLNNLSTIGKIFATIGYFVYPLVAGAILAYLMNPLMRFFEERVFKKISNAKAKRSLSLLISVLIVVLFIAFIVGMLIPQLADSAMTLFKNKDAYLEALSNWLESIGAGSVMSNFEGLVASSQDLLKGMSTFISDNSDKIESAITKVGGHVGSWVIGMIFSVYFLAAKDKIKAGASRLVKDIFRKPETNGLIFKHLKKIDSILTRYIIFSIIDGIIVGLVNGIFMKIAGMQYAGLISVIVGVTNLVPTFGPIVGALFGALVLLMVNPMHALYFLIFTIILQTVDGYIFKPKLFGDTFGISGLWILVAIIVGGRIFGVIGIILAIPAVAIIDYLIKEVLAPFMKKKRELHGEAG